MSSIRPIRDQVLIKQDPPKEKLASGLFVPDGVREKYEDIGTVLEVGPGKPLENGSLLKPAVEKGDRVMFKRRPGSHLGDANPEWKDLLMLRDEDIMGVIYEE
jgi:chaperonin GroES